MNICLKIMQCVMDVPWISLLNGGVPGQDDGTLSYLLCTPECCNQTTLMKQQHIARYYHILHLALTHSLQANCNRNALQILFLHSTYSDEAITPT